MAATVGDYILWLAIAACVVFLASVGYATLRDRGVERD